MAIRTDDIALGCLGKELLPILERSPALREVKRLLVRIPMVEVHLMAGKPTATVGTGDVTKLPQERSREVLPTSHPLDLARPVRRVEANVRGSLVALCGHAEV